MDDSVDFPLGDLVLSVAGLTIVPVLIGMAIHKLAPAFCARLEEPSKIFASIFLVVVVTALVATNWGAVVDVVDNVGRFAPAFIALNVLALGVGYSLATAAGIRRPQSSTIAIEMGLQNLTLALTIAASVLGNSEMAIIPGLYGVWMLFTGFGFAFGLKSLDDRVDSRVGPQT